MPLNKVPAQAIAGKERALQIDSAADAKLPEVRHVECLLQEIEGDGLSSHFRYREAAPVDGHALAKSEFGREGNVDVKASPTIMEWSHLSERARGFNDTREHGGMLEDEEDGEEEHGQECGEADGKRSKARLLVEIGALVLESLAFEAGERPERILNHD